LVTVFLISYLILLLLKWRESRRVNANNRTQTNSFYRENTNNANDANNGNREGQQTTNADEKEKKKSKPNKGNDSKQT